MDITPQKLKSPVSYRSVLTVLIISVGVLAIAAYMYILSLKSDFAVDIGFNNSQAAPGDVVMTLKAVPVSVIVGQAGQDEFVLNVELDTGGKTATAAEVHLTFPTSLQLIASSSGPLMSNVFQNFPKIPGRADIVVGVPIRTTPTPTPQQGSQCAGGSTCVIATFRLKATAPGSFTITIDGSTQVSTLENLGSNALTTRVPVTVTGTNPTPTPTPTVVSFTASPATIRTGAGAPVSLTSSTLSWGVQNSTSVTIDNGVGTVSATGTRVVSPVTTTTYTLSAVNTGGTTTRTAVITARNISDLDLDGDVDIFDYSSFVGVFGQTTGPADMNLDGSINIFDYTILVTNFGR